MLTWRVWHLGGRVAADRRHQAEDGGREQYGITGADTHGDVAF